MHVHPDIAALRSNGAPQRLAQGSMDGARDLWRAEPGAAQMLAELEEFGKGAFLEACPQLERVFTGQGEAERLAGLLVRHYCAAIAANPFAHPSFRHGFDGISGTLLLARSGRAMLTLQSREPGAVQCKAYGFTAATRFDAVIAGKAQGRIVRIVCQDGDKARFASEDIKLARGVRLALDTATETLLIEDTQQRLITLRLSRTAQEPAPSREYDAASGRMVHQSAARISTSRQEAIVALLGRLGRKDAAPEMVRIALSDEDTSLRWQALRECIALDSEAGFGALTQVSRRAGDPIAADAGALRAQLLETYPQFAVLETPQCPA